MPAHAYTYDQLVEQPAIALFPVLRWTPMSALEESFGATGALLRAALERLIPALPSEAITSVVDESTRDLLLPRMLSGQIAPWSGWLPVREPDGSMRA